MKIAAVTATPIRIPLTQFLYNSENAGTKREWGGRLSRVSPKRPSPILEYGGGQECRSGAGVTAGHAAFRS